MLYDLTLYVWTSGNRRSDYEIGLFRSRREAEAVEARYLKEVPGFRDYACWGEITEVLLVDGPGEVFWQFAGWNLDEEGDKTDCLKSGCYSSRERAQADLERAKGETPREEWALNRCIPGFCYFREGFVRKYPDGRTALTIPTVRQTLEEAVASRGSLRLCFDYEDEASFLYPLAVGEHLFLGMEEFDFQLDGFTVRRLRDVEELEPVSGKYREIAVGEGLPEQLHTPCVELSHWGAVFTSLRRLGHCVIVERAYLEEGHPFAVGLIRAVREDRVELLAFDADGVWEPEPWTIAFEDITSVTFDSQYIRVFSKYLAAPPPEAAEEP